MMFDILRQIKSGCVVVGPDLRVLHANDMARNCFPRPNRAGGQLSISTICRKSSAARFLKC